jgi:hypothetical protein
MAPPTNTQQLPFGKTEDNGLKESDAELGGVAVAYRISHLEMGDDFRSCIYQFNIPRIVATNAPKITTMRHLDLLMESLRLFTYCS